MIDPKLPELFAERPVRSDFSRARTGPSYALRRVITVMVLLGLIGGGVYLKLRVPSHATPGEIPTIKADGAYKTRPDQPGGIDIPHQDVQVYQELDNNVPQKPQVEHLLPPPEVPEASQIPIPPKTVVGLQSTVESLMVKEGSVTIEQKPAIGAPEVAPAPSAPPVQLIASPVPPKTAPQAMPQTVAAVAPPQAPPDPALEASAAVKTESAVQSSSKTLPLGKAPIATTVSSTGSSPSMPSASTTSTSTTSISTLSTTTPSQVGVGAAPRSTSGSTPHPENTASASPTIEQVLKDASAEGQTASASATPKASQGGFLIQLASIPDQAGAEEAMAKLQAKYSSILGNVQLQLTKADLGAKGIFYRIQGRAVSAQQANSICASLKDMKAGCIIVRP